MIYISFLVAFMACVIGKVCGMGGGVIIKPVLDALNVMDRSAINFVSSCTVLGMTCWSVGRSLARGSTEIDVKHTTPLAVGAAVGGIAGKSLFIWVRSLFPNPDTASGVQAAVLLVLTFATLLYTLRKDKIKSFKIENMALTSVIGLALGMIGSFLGIGGGPFNVAALFLFFQMDTKTAAANSLYVIFFSQLLNLIWTALNRAIPQVDILFLFVMIVSGVLGSELGQVVVKKISDKQTTVLFEMSMVLVMGINVYNIIQSF